MYVARSGIKAPLYYRVACVIKAEDKRYVDMTALKSLCHIYCLLTVTCTYRAIIRVAVLMYTLCFIP
jgi:hypothetical protein